MQEPTFLILTALAAGAQHGYGIMTDVIRISDGRVRLRAGTLYAALDRLKADGLVTSDREELVDGRRRGRTPTQLSVPPGDRHVTFQGSSVVPATVEVQAIARQTAVAKATLWLRTPVLDLLRTPFPGTSVAVASFLADGRVSLTVTLPPGDEHQLWVRARDGGFQRRTELQIERAGRDAQDGEETDQRAERNDPPGGEGGQDAPDEGRRQGEVGQQRGPPTAERQSQQQQYQQAGGDLRNAVGAVAGER